MWDPAVTSLSQNSSVLVFSIWGPYQTPPLWAMTVPNLSSLSGRHQERRTLNFFNLCPSKCCMCVMTTGPPVRRRARRSMPTDAVALKGISKHNSQWDKFMKSSSPIHQFFNQDPKLQSFLSISRFFCTRFCCTFQNIPVLFSELYCPTRMNQSWGVFFVSFNSYTTSRKVASIK